MDSLDRFLQRLLREGRVVFRGRPAPDEGPRAAVGLLERAYATYRLDVPGAAIPFDPGVGLAAAELVRQACWALVSREDRAEDLERKLRMPHGPNRPSHHLSADLVLRFLPQVHRRARGVDPGDPLVGMLAKILRDWPLSGVLADLGEGPESPPDLGGHEGLMLLYAERLARRENPSWRPSGRAMEFVELVLRERGRDLSPLLAEKGGGHG